jgi:hypothetical protein
MLKKYMEERELHVNVSLNENLVLHLHLNENGSMQPFFSYTQNSSTHRTRQLVAEE